VRGLTLLELLVTLSIMAILLTLGVTSFSGFFDKRRLAQATEQVYSDLQWARMSAMQFNNSVTVSLSGEGSANWGYVISGAVSKSVTGIAEITFANSSFSSDAVTFQAAGGAANTGTIRLVSAGNDELRIVVSGRGRVRICDANNSMTDYEAC